MFSLFRIGNLVEHESAIFGVFRARHTRDELYEWKALAVGLNLTHE